MIPFHGPAATVQNAFATELSQFALPGGGTAHAPTTSVSLPAGVAGYVRAVLGLNDLVREHRLGPARPANRRTATPAAPRPHGAVATTPGGPKACPTRPAPPPSSAA